MSNPTSTALAQRQEHPAARLQQQYAARLASLVPSHVNGEAWVRQATGALRNEDLAAAAQNDFGSFVTAVERAAVLGLRPASEEYYLVPRKVKQRLQVMGIVGWQGLVELMYRSGAVSAVVAEVVYQHDVFVWKPGQLDTVVPPRWTGPQLVPLHEVDWDAEDRGALRLVYAYARMTDGGTSRVVVMNRADIAKIKAASDGAGSQYSPWVKWEPQMWLKTGVRQLAKWVPTSVERVAQHAQAHAVAAQAAAALPAAVPAALPPAASRVELTSEGHVDTATGELLDDVAPPSDDDQLPDPTVGGDPWAGQQ